MRQRSSIVGLFAPAVVALVAFGTACGGSTGPGSNNFARVTMSQALAGPPSPTSVGPAVVGDDTGSIVSPNAVGQLSVQLDRVELQRSGSGTWVSVSVTARDGSVDLQNLPGPRQGQEVAAAEVDPGDYRNVRVSLSGARVTFTEEVTVPGVGDAASQTFEAGTTHDLTLTGGSEAGFEIPTNAFSISDNAGATVQIVVDLPTSVTGMAVSQQGLQMAPAFSAEARGAAGTDG